MPDDRAFLAREQEANMRRTTLAAAIATALVLGGISSALGARPNNQACLGEDFSTYAREGSELNGPGSGFGQFNAALARSVPGLGLPIQLHLAGLTSDEVVLNSCNDD